MAITYSSIGSKAVTGTTDQLVFHPSSVPAGRMMVVARAIWFGTATGVTPSGWTLRGDVTGGVNLATDDHTTRALVYTREADGSEGTTNTNFQAATSPTGAASVSETIAKDASRGWATPVSVTGTDNTHGANRSVTSTSTLNLAPGDLVHITVAFDTDVNLTITAPAISSTGITFSAVSARTAGIGSTTGSDGNVRTFSAMVNSGTGTNTVTFSFTTTTLQCGPVIFTRLREQNWVQQWDDNIGITDSDVDFDHVPGATDHDVTPADNMGLTDSFTKEIHKTFFDPLNLTDDLTFEKELSRLFEDTVGITDLLAFEKARDLQMLDNLGLTDLMRFDQSKLFVDPMGLTDTVRFDRSKLIEDTMGLTDSFAVSKGRLEIWQDTMGLTDSLNFTIGKTFTDSMQITDVLLKDQHKLFVDDVGITDSVFFLLPLTFNITDTMGLTDTLDWVEFEQHIKEPSVSLIDDKRELAIAFLLANTAYLEFDLRLLSIMDLAHKYWSFKAGQLDNQARSILDHMMTFDPTKDPWDWLTAIE